MMHMVAYQKSIDEGGVLSYITPVPDPSVRVNNNDIVVPQDVNQLIGAVACVGTTGSQAQLISPSLRRTNPYNIQPVLSALVSGNRVNYGIHEGSPIQLDYNEALNGLINADPAAAEVHSIVAFLADGPIAPVTGKIKKVRFSVTGALTAGVWSNLTIDFPDLLPTGVYTVVGSELVIANAVAARWYPVGGKWRPGFLPSAAYGQSTDPKFRNGMLGKWFDFDETQPPTIDILVNTTAVSTTYYGTMDVIPAQAQ